MRVAVEVGSTDDDGCCIAADVADIDCWMEEAAADVDTDTGVVSLDV